MIKFCFWLFAFKWFFLLKFVFSKKATKIDEIFTDNLTLTTWCQIGGEDFVNFCGLLRKHKQYLSSWQQKKFEYKTKTYARFSHDIIELPSKYFYLLYGLHYKTCTFKASRIWNWDSTGCLIENFTNRNLDFLDVHVQRLAKVLGCLIKTFCDKFSTRSLIEHDA